MMSLPCALGRSGADFKQPSRSPPTSLTGAKGRDIKWRSSSIDVYHGLRRPLTAVSQTVGLLNQLVRRRSRSWKPIAGLGYWVPALLTRLPGASRACTRSLPGLPSPSGALTGIPMPHLLSDPIPSAPSWSLTSRNPAACPRPARRGRTFFGRLQAIRANGNCGLGGSHHPRGGLPQPCWPAIWRPASAWTTRPESICFRRSKPGDSTHQRPLNKQRFEDRSVESRKQPPGRQGAYTGRPQTGDRPDDHLQPTTKAIGRFYKRLKRRGEGWRWSGFSGQAPSFNL